jgi:putative iron-regulated protein
LARPAPETLAAARAAWVKARPAYLRTETFRFADGPIEALEGRLNAWPVNEAVIDYVAGDPKAGLVNDPSRPVTLATINALDQARDEADVTTGWHAIEFLLWGQDLSKTGPGNRPYTDYVAGPAANGRRRAYLTLVAQQLTDDLAGLVRAWDRRAAASYAARLKALPDREVIGRALNGMAILAAFETAQERMAVALDSGDQEDEHSCFSDTTHQDFVHNLAGIEAVWTRGGLGALTARRDARLKAEVDALFAKAEAAVAALDQPWDQVLASPPGSPPRQEAEAAIDSLRALGQGLKRAGQALGVLVQIPS